MRIKQHLQKHKQVNHLNNLSSSREKKTKLSRSESFRFLVRTKPTTRKSESHEKIHFFFSLPLSIFRSTFSLPSSIGSLFPNLFISASFQFSLIFVILCHHDEIEELKKKTKITLKILLLFFKCFLL